MSLTLNDVLDKLKQIDEISLLEILEITSEDIIDRFTDKVEEKLDSLMDDFIEDEEW